MKSEAQMSEIKVLQMFFLCFWHTYLVLDHVEEMPVLLELWQKTDEQ